MKVRAAFALLSVPPLVNRSAISIPENVANFNPPSGGTWRDFWYPSWAERINSPVKLRGCVAPRHEGAQARGEKKKSSRLRGLWWAGKDLNLRRLSQRIYSPPPLATWVPAQDVGTIIPIPGELSTPDLGFASQEEASRVAQVLGQASPGIGIHGLAPDLAGPQVKAPVGLVPLAHHQLGRQCG